MPTYRLLRRFALMSACAFAAAGSIAALAASPPDLSRPTPSSDSDPFPITVRVQPGVVMVGKPGPGTRKLSIAGETLPAGQRTVAITIKAEGGAIVATEQAKPDAKGNYNLAAAAPSKAGVYEVAVIAPDGRGKAGATFRAVEASGLGPQAEAILNDAIKAADDGVKAAEAKIDTLTESPPKDKAKKKLADAKRALGELRDRSGAAPIKGLIGAISSDAALQEALRPQLDAVTSAIDATSNETDRVRKLTAEMSGADIGCHKLAFATEFFKAVSALLNVKKRVLDTSIGLAKDVVSDVVTNKGKAAGASPAQAFASGQVAKNLPELESASKLAGNTVGILTDLSAFFSDTLFSTYCEQFVGPLNAIMNARFFTYTKAAGDFKEWWSYNYKVTGRVVLYYPKGAKGGQPVRLNGRIEGYAHGFETWEDALTVMFPKLMAGAVQYKFNYPPIEMGGTASNMATQGASPMSAYVEGSTAGLAMPNSFLIPVEGVLEKDSITILLGQAKSDISATHRVAALIVSPLSGGAGPQITWYPLAVLKVRPFLANVADGQSLKLSVKQQGDKMLAERVFTGNVDKQKAKAEFTLKMKLCNPGC